jgi:alkaline phosphatase
MKIKKYLALFVLLTLILSSYGQNEKKAVKNVIMMVSDGTSIEVLALARWYKGGPLALDSIICGLIKTSSSDSTIADSAPAATAYSTGFKSKSGFIGVSGDSIIPKITVLEMAKIKGKSTGIVVTCESPHATPAAFSSHTQYRKDYETINEQQVFNNLDVVFSGGGYNFLNKTVFDKNKCMNPLRADNMNLRDSLLKLGYKFISSKAEFLKLGKEVKVWGSFNSDTINLANDFDNRKKLSSLQSPTLAEMTGKAIEILSQNKDGFFMLVEGSKVDFCAHNNDPVGLLSEFLAFDSAVSVALNFAKKNGNTVVIVCPDHGTGGITIGNDQTSNSYNKTKYTDIVSTLKKAKVTAEGLSLNISKMVNNNITDTSLLFKNIDSLYNIKMDWFEKFSVVNCIENNKNCLIDPLQRIFGKMLSKRAKIGWTTEGHTGGDVFMGIYHPNNYRLSGIIENNDIAKYISEVLALGNLNEESKKYFCNSKTIFPNDKFKVTLDKSKLIAEEISGERSFYFPANRNYFVINDMKNKSKSHKIKLKTLCVFVNNAFYIPSEVKEHLK